MRTVNKVGGANGTTFTEFYGNTTDVKPTEDVPNGSAFYEVDNNMQEYRFDKENKIWYPITRGGTAPSDEYLPLSGGIMTGDINMNGNSLLNAKSIYANDNTDINKVKYISGLLPTNIFINNYNTVGYNLVGINISENTFTFYSNDKNNKHSQIEIIYNVEDNLPRLSFEAGYNDRINLPVLLKGVDTPVDDTDAANKQYVDQETAKCLPLTGGKMTGNIDLNNKSIYRISDLTFNPEVQLKSGAGNNRIYLRVIRNGTDNKLSVKAADAVEDDELVTKSQMETADSKYLPLIGITEDNPVTGVVTFNGESTITGVSTPVNDTDVVTKKYVDNNLVNYYKIDGTTPMTVCNIGGSEDASKFVKITASGNQYETYLSFSNDLNNTVRLNNVSGFTYNSLNSVSLYNNAARIRVNDVDYSFSATEMIIPSRIKLYAGKSNSDGRVLVKATRYTGTNNYLALTLNKFDDQSTTYVDSTIGIENVRTPKNDTDAVNKQYVDNTIKSITENQVTIQKADNANMCINLTVNGDEVSGILDLTDKNGNPVIVRGVDTPVQDTDAVNKKYFETHLPTDFTPTKDLDMKQYKLINTSAVEIYGGINDSANNTYFIRETSQASINTDTKIPEYVKVITGVHTGDTNQDVILRGIRAGQQKNDAVNYGQFKTLADSFERCQHDVESLNAWKMTFDENQVTNTVNSIIKYTDVAYELTIASGEEQWYSYDLAMQSGYTPISATLVIDDTNPFVGHCSLDITPDGTYNALIYLKSQGDDKTCNCKVRLVWIKNQ